jgi:hypothetical protein
VPMVCWAIICFLSAEQRLSREVVWGCDRSAICHPVHVQCNRQLTRCRHGPLLQMHRPFRNISDARSIRDARRPAPRACTSVYGRIEARAWPLIYHIGTAQGPSSPAPMAVHVAACMHGVCGPLSCMPTGRYISYVATPNRRAYPAVHARRCGRSARCLTQLIADGWFGRRYVPTH